MQSMKPQPTTDPNPAYMLNHSNGHSEHSPNSSHLSLEIARAQKQHTTQQVTTVTKVVREVGQTVDYMTMPIDVGSDQTEYVSMPLVCTLPRSQYGVQPQHAFHYSDYDHYPNAYQADPNAYAADPNAYSGDPNAYSADPNAYSADPNAYQADPNAYQADPNAYPTDQNYQLNERSTSSYIQRYQQQFEAPCNEIGFRMSGFEEDDGLANHMSNLQLHNHVQHNMISPPNNAQNANEIDEQRQTRWRDPNLTEVISFLNNPNNVIKANAAAYLQHLCYMDDPNKQRTRTLGGIPPLVRLLEHESSDVFRNACGALRNLSYGRQNDENKRAIKNAGGIQALVNLLQRTNETDVKELVTGVIWNMSSCEDLKRSIIDDAVIIIVSYIIIPHSGWDPRNPGKIISGETCWSTVFRNASGILRNVSSAGEYARTKLRECVGLVDSLLYVVRIGIDRSNIGNKIVENCVCILRNLSYRCQEVEDSNYDKNPLPQYNSGEGSSANGGSVPSTSKSENLGCFGASKKKKEQQNAQQLNENKDVQLGAAGSLSNSSQRKTPAKGTELLWQPEVVPTYLTLLQSCSNPETLEAAAGALQNLAACYWQPSIEIRAAVRKEKGLPILVELLRMEVDRVVCAVATALRNLAIDQRNKELIGKYAMRDLVQKLPSGIPHNDQGTSDDTIAAVLATLNEVIKKNAEFSRSLLDAGGVDRLMNITRQRQKYTPRVLKFAGQVLFTMWQHQELRDVYKKHNWKEQDFVTKTIAARNANNNNNTPNSPNNPNNTLNRPISSQSSTRYEDRTLNRQQASSQQQQQNKVTEYMR